MYDLNFSEEFTSNPFLYFNESDLRPLPFNRSIQLKNISFRYSDSSPLILDNFNLEIMKGDVIGIVGQTGLGKSTLVDLIMGLITPTSGSLLVDNQQLDFQDPAIIQSWKKTISHVPQKIHLIDASIEQNVAFGVAQEDINSSNLVKSCHHAMMKDIIESMPFGYKTIIGEQELS